MAARPRPHVFQAWSTALRTGSGPGKRLIWLGHPSIYPFTTTCRLLFWVSGSCKALEAQKKIQPPRNSQTQESQPLYPQGLGMQHGPTVPGMTQSQCLLSERFCSRVPFLTPLRPQVRFLDSMSETNLPKLLGTTMGTLSPRRFHGEKEPELSISGARSSEQ